MLEDRTDFTTRRCVYCGITADSRDHFLPLSFQRSGKRKAEWGSQKWNLVPACRECNMIAGNKVFSFLGEKRHFIQERLRTRYEKYLKAPTWSQTELEEMGRGLRLMIQHKMFVKSVTICRLNYPRSLVPEVSVSEIARLFKK